MDPPGLQVLEELTVALKHLEDRSSENQSLGATAGSKWRSSLGLTQTCFFLCEETCMSIYIYICIHMT